MCQSSGIPCCKCGGPVVEFSVSNVAWNLIIRNNGPETDQEYLCLECFAILAASKIERLQSIVDNLDKWRSRAIQFWQTAMPDLDDDIGRRAAGDLLLWIDEQIGAEHAAEKAKEEE